MKKTLILFFISQLTLLTVGNTQSKFNNNWDIGIFLGMSQHGGDVQSWGTDGESIFNQSNLSYGLNVKYNIDESWSARLNYWGSKIEGIDNQIENEFGTGHDMRGFSFESNLSEISLVGIYEIGGKKRWKRSESFSTDKYELITDENGSYYVGHKKSITPYLFGGIGFSITDPTIDWNGLDGGNPGIFTDISYVTKTNFQVPVGIGLNFDLSKNIYLGLEASSRIPLNDYIDGISESANPDKNDSYQFLGLNLGIRLGGDDNDMDNDGFKDEEDLCPDTPGHLQGCPDTDGDGLNDLVDACPTLFGPGELEGCPDSDNDGVIDKLDDCPEDVGPASLRGCPDSDGDRVPDIEDQCPTEIGPAFNNGCPDNDPDKDGFLNAVDECPTVKGTLNGCPDTDNDGIADAKDGCPNLFGTMNGCPDTDNDGIADNFDACPTVKGPTSNNGCPVEKIKVDSKTVINNYRIRDIHFNSNSAGLTDESKIRIDEIVSFAANYPQANFHIAGYTDNVGAAEANLRLSKRRAEMVYNTLLARGIAQTRLSFDGYGESDFIDTNDTEVGRFNNRRVEVRANTK